MSSQNPRALTLNHASAGIALGSTSTHTIATTTVVSINGVFATAVSNAATQASPTTDWATGLAFRPLSPNKCTVIVIGQNLAGAIKMCQGSIVDTYPGVTTTKGDFKEFPQFPALPDDFCPLSYALIRTAPSAAVWTPCTSSWTASGVFSGNNGTTTTTQVNGTLPERPMSA